MGFDTEHLSAPTSDLVFVHELVQYLRSFEDHPITPMSLKPGDHVIAKRLFGLYTHHALYIGGGRVVHYAPDKATKTKGRVQESDLATLRQKSRLYVRRYKFRDIGEVDFQNALERAKSRLGENRYHLLTANCEHFVEWCVLGTSRSGQITRISLLSTPSLAERP